MEKIIRVEECTFKREKDDWDNFEGFQIITDKQTIKLGISNSQSCCESWGYFMSEDDISEFINSELIGIEIVDTELKSKLKEICEYGLDEGNTMFVNIKTSTGILQFTAYNSHNGYYGHNAVVISEQINHVECL